MSVEKLVESLLNEAPARASHGRPSFREALSQYRNRYTMEHIPSSASKPAPNGKYYAPHYKTDREWYDNTLFPGEPGCHTGRSHCQSSNQTWPMGEWLDAPMSR